MVYKNEILKNNIFGPYNNHLEQEEKKLNQLKDA